jgi:ubiquinone biosynthesis protein
VLDELERLGPVYVRFGRFLALRSDLIPDEFREVLLDLPDRWPAAPWSEVKAFLDAELTSLGAGFENLNPLPVASRSLFQVHRATTRDGSRVLVKIVRPGTRERVRRDLRRLGSLARPLGWTRSRLLNVRQEFADELNRELDLNNELDNIRKLAAFDGANGGFFIPKAYPELSTANVLTIEDAGGILLSDFLSPARRLELNTADAGLDPALLAKNLLRVTLRQTFERRFYNADLHPANILLLPGNAIGFSGFGMCAEVEEDAAHLQVRFLGSVFSTDLDRLFQTFGELLATEGRTASEQMREDFIAESHRWLREAPPGRREWEANGHRSPLSNWLLAILRTLHRANFDAPPDVLTAWRTLALADNMANRLDSSVHLQSTGMEVLKDLDLDHAFRIFEPGVQRTIMADLLTTLRGAPEYVNQILAETAMGRLTVNLNTAHTGLAGKTRDRRVKLIVAGIAAVGLAWLIGEPLGLPRRVLAAALGLLYLYILVQWRKLGR